MKKKLLLCIFFLLMFMVTVPVYGATIYEQSASKDNPAEPSHNVKAEDNEIVVQIHIEDTGYYEFDPRAGDLRNYIIYVYKAKFDTKDESKLIGTLRPPFDFSGPIYCEADSYITFIYTPDPVYIPGYFYISVEYVGEDYEWEDPEPEGHFPHDFSVPDGKIPATFTKDGLIQLRCVCYEVEEAYPIPKVSNVKLPKTSYVYSGKSHKPRLVVKDRLGKTLKLGKDYHLKYDKNTRTIGSHTVKIILAGNYKGSRKYTYKILPKVNGITRVKGLENGFKVTWSKGNNITGYQIRYAANSKMTKAKIIKVGRKNFSKTIFGLSRGRKYYVQVRTYKTVKKKVYPSAWSKAKSVKIR